MWSTGKKTKEGKTGGSTDCFRPSAKRKQTRASGRNKNFLSCNSTYTRGTPNTKMQKQRKINKAPTTGN